MKALPPAGVFNICVDDGFDAKSSFFCVYIMAPKNILIPTSHN